MIEEEKEYDEIFDRFDPLLLEKAFKRRMELENGEYEDKEPCSTEVLLSMDIDGCEEIKRFWLCPEERCYEEFNPPISREDISWKGEFLNPRGKEEIKYVNAFCKLRNNFGKYLIQALDGVDKRLPVTAIADRLSEVTKESEEIGIPIRMKEKHLEFYLEKAVDAGVLGVNPRSYGISNSPECPHCGGELPEEKRLPNYPYEEVMPEPDD
ncbi:MAG: hypothetical protein ABEK17_01240 [Candidatus Aenigmatarchaeota archaeon]